jgi:hypothetical protein
MRAAVLRREQAPIRLTSTYHDGAQLRDGRTQVGHGGLCHGGLGEGLLEMVLLAAGQGEALGPYVPHGSLNSHGLKSEGAPDLVSAGSASEMKALKD